MALFQAIYHLLWGDLITIPLPGGSSLGLSLLVLILIPAGLYFTIRTRFLPFRLFPEMCRVTLENNKSSSQREGISGVQALIVSYGIPILLQSNGIMFRWPELVIPAMLVCALNSAAYMAEIIRGGIQAVDHGQIEAALSLGMTGRQINRLIVLPQAFRIVLPSFGNEFITLIKETAVLAFVGVPEILRNAQLWNASTFETFPAYIGAAVVYLMITYPLSKGVAALEKHMAKEIKEK